MFVLGKVAGLGRDFKVATPRDFLEARLTSAFITIFAVSLIPLGKDAFSSLLSGLQLCKMLTRVIESRFEVGTIHRIRSE